MLIGETNRKVCATYLKHRHTHSQKKKHCSTQYQHTVTTSDFHVPFKNNKIQLSSSDWRGMIVSGFKTKRSVVLKWDVWRGRERIYKYMLVENYSCFPSGSRWPHPSHTGRPLSHLNSGFSYWRQRSFQPLMSEDKPFSKNSSINWEVIMKILK